MFLDVAPIQRESSNSILTSRGPTAWTFSSPLATSGNRGCWFGTHDLATPPSSPLPTAYDEHHAASRHCNLRSGLSSTTWKTRLVDAHNAASTFFKSNSRGPTTLNCRSHLYLVAHRRVHDTLETRKGATSERKTVFSRNHVPVFWQPLSVLCPTFTQTCSTFHTSTRVFVVGLRFPSFCPWFSKRRLVPTDSKFDSWSGFSQTDAFKKIFQIHGILWSSKSRTTSCVA